MKIPSTWIANPGAVSSGSENNGSATSYNQLGSIPAVLSFDVEEHDRIEAAVGLEIDSRLNGDHRQRLNQVTGWILEQLAEWELRATFFIVDEIGTDGPSLVRSIHEAGHEVASHGWDHRRIHVMTPEVFREDGRKSQDALEQACGMAVVGYRAPPFGLVKRTAWALDVLAELGLLYDSSIRPVLHDRYGVPGAPRGSFLARGSCHEILEIPPATVRIGEVNVPVGGGGYSRLLPAPLLKLALALPRRDPQSRATVLYFHPWELDPGQARLPSKRLNHFRTYVGIRHSRGRLTRLLAGYLFIRAADLARQLQERREELPRFCPAPRARRLVQTWNRGTSFRFDRGKTNVPG